MPAEQRIALLIDAENVGSEQIEPVLAYLLKRGRVTVRRAYADWSSPRSEHWTPVLRSNAIRASHLTSVNAAGKNAADIALVIDAMDLLHAGTVDVLAVVSSDGDFTPLALRAREGGLSVLGFGRTEASEALRQSCEFVTFENLTGADAAPTFGGRTAMPLPQQRQAAARSDGALHAWLTKTVRDVTRENGWAYLAQLGPALQQVVADAGYTRPSALLRATEKFDVQLDRVRVRRSEVEKGRAES